MDRYLVVRGKFVEHRYGAYVRHDTAQAEIQKRDARIAELEAQLAACAAGPWRKPTEDEAAWISNSGSPEAAELIAADVGVVLHFGTIHDPVLVATINPPEADSCAR